MLLGISAGAIELHIVTEDLPPLSYEENGVVKGYSTELLQAVLQVAEIKASIQILPWARAYQTSLVQPNTLIYSMTRLPERDALFEWIGPISPRQIFLYKLRDRKEIQVKSLPDVVAYRVGLVREMASSKEFVKVSGLPESVFDYAPTADSNMKKLWMRRIDLLVSLDWSAAFLAKSLDHKPEELEPVLMLDNQHSYYFAMNKQSDPVLVNKLRQAFEKIQLSGKMDKLRTKYLR